MVLDTSTETNETLDCGVIDILLEVSTIVVVTIVFDGVEGGDGVVGVVRGGVLGREFGIIYGIMLNKKIQTKYDGY